MTYCCFCKKVGAPGDPTPLFHPVVQVFKIVFCVHLGALVVGLSTFKGKNVYQLRLFSVLRLQNVDVVRHNF